MARTAAVGNRKGGCGKTTSAVNKTASLAAKKKRTLLVDCDPQGDATKACGVEVAVGKTLYEVFTGQIGIREAITKTEYGFDIVTANANLAAVEVEITPDSVMGHFKILKNALAEIQDDYDFIILDLPPSLGKLTINGLVAADELIIPINSQHLALEGAKEMTETTLRYITEPPPEPGREALNSTLELKPFMTMYKGNEKLSRWILADAEEYFSSIPRARLLKTKIKSSVRFGEAPYVGIPALIACPDTHTVQMYHILTKEAFGV